MRNICSCADNIGDGKSLSSSDIIGTLEGGYHRELMLFLVSVVLLPVLVLCMIVLFITIDVCVCVHRSPDWVI